MDETKATSRIAVQLPDPMRHFSREGAVVKLLALAICKLPSLVAAVGTVVALAGRAFKWW